MTNLWFSYHDGVFNEQLDDFFSPDDWAYNLNDYIQNNLNEIQGYLKDNPSGFEPYFNETISSQQGGWSTIPFVFWGEKHNNRLHFQELWNHLQNVPNMVGAGISKLKAGSEILAHRGETNAIVRSHFTICSDTSCENTYFKVNESKRAWTHNEPLSFCDAHLHEAINKSSQDRIILIVDTIRQEFIEHTDMICAHSLAILSAQLDCKKTGDKVDSKFYFECLENHLSDRGQTLYKP